MDGPIAGRHYPFQEFSTRLFFFRNHKSRRSGKTRPAEYCLHFYLVADKSDQPNKKLYCCFQPKKNAHNANENYHPLQRFKPVEIFSLQRSFSLPMWFLKKWILRVQTAIIPRWEGMKPMHFFCRSSAERPRPSGIWLATVETRRRPKKGTSQDFRQSRGSRCCIHTGTFCMHFLLSILLVPRK